MPEKCEALEELRWAPGVPDCDLMMYLLAARSITAFAGMCDGGCAENGCVAASRDDTTINAMDMLHESFYDTGKALQALVQNPIPSGVEKKWLEDDQKRFVKGLRQCGKNFFRIKKELLPHKETSDLVEYYYLWKKFPGAVTSRTHRRNRRQTTLRRIKPSPRPNRPSSNDFSMTLAKQYSAEASSGSDDGEDSEDSDSRGDTTGYTCQNCFTTTSEYWLPVGKDLAVMCSECELYYKKHGEMRPVMDSKENLPYLFQPVGDDDDVSQGGKHVMRTRQSKERQSPKTVASEANAAAAAAAAKGGRKSPGAASNCSTGSTDRDKKKKLPQDLSQKGGKRKIKTEKNPEGETEDEKSGTPKKKVARTDSPSESVCTESSVSSEKNAPENDGTSSPSLGPSPALSPCPQQVVPVDAKTEKPEEIASTEPLVEPLPLSVMVKEELDLPLITAEEPQLPPLQLPPPQTPPAALLPPQVILPIIQIKQEAEEEQPPPNLPSKVEQVEEDVASLSTEMVNTIVEQVKEEAVPKPEIVEELSISAPGSPSFSALQPSLPPLPLKDMSPPSPPIKAMSPPMPVPPRPASTEPCPENMMQVALYPTPESIKTEAVELPPTPPPLPVQPHPPPPTGHETAAVHHSYSHTSSTAHYSNNISIDMSNSSYGSSSSITASSSISVSYQSHHGKMQYPGHLPPLMPPQSTLSAFGYRPFSPQYSPYSPGMLPYLPPSQQPPKLKFSPSPSGGSQTPPPLATSPPYVTPGSAPHSVPALMESPQQQQQQQSYKHQHHQQQTREPGETSTGSSRGSVLNLSAPVPQSSNSAVGSSSSTSASSSHIHTSSGSKHTSQYHSSTTSADKSSHQSSQYTSVVEGHHGGGSGSSGHHRSFQRVSQMPPMLRGLPMPSQHLPPTSYISSQLPFPSQQGHGPPDRGPPIVEQQQQQQQQEKFCPAVPEQVTLEEEEDPEPHVVARGPSPEPRVDDAECHRSQSAIFLRHWNRGECNSCARTDLTFKPVPDTKLARKREETARKAAEKERERLKARMDSTPEGKPGSSSHGDSHHMSPFESPLSRGSADNSALRQLGEYARPHAATFATQGYGRQPQAVGPGNIPLGVLPHGIDPILHYQLSSGMYGAAARERYTLEIEMEREKRERDLHEKLKAEYEMKSRLPPGAYDPHWVELQRRYGALQAGPSVGVNPGHPGRPFGLYSPAERERMGIPPNVPVSEATMDRINAERAHSERLMLSTDPLLRLQMAGLAPELHTHAHTHAHAHTHLHLHPHDAVSAAAMGVPPHLLNEQQVHPGGHPLLPPSGYPPGGPRPGGVSRQELMHPAATGMLRPPYDEQLAHQLSAQLVHHEQLQRQLLIERERQFLIERERSAHMGAQMAHPSQLLSQQEEFLRQREREAKYRTIEEWKKHLGDGGGHP